MKKERYKNLDLELYDTPMELPSERFSLLNKYIMIDSGIGATMEDFDRHLNVIKKYISQDNKSKASLEIDNMRQCYWLVMNGITPEVSAFACFVKSINGHNYEQNEQGVQAISKRIKESSMPMGLIKTILNSLKKKSTKN